MAEPDQPPAIQEGMPLDAEEETPALPADAEGRKAAAALSSLDANNHADDGAPKTQADTEALGKAMSQLAMSGGEKAGGKGEKKEAEVKKKVKVEAGDVVLLVEELELSRSKATELLKAHEGNVVKAISAFVAVGS